MTSYSPSTKKPFPVALALGLLGGAALIITMQLTTNGPAIYIPYAALVIATFAAVRMADWPAFSRRFATAFLAFMVATIILYFFLGTFAAGGSILDISVWGHVWRIGFMAVIGGLLSAAVAYLADIGLQREA